MQQQVQSEGVTMSGSIHHWSNPPLVCSVHIQTGRRHYGDALVGARSSYYVGQRTAVLYTRVL